MFANEDASLLEGRFPQTSKKNIKKIKAEIKKNEKKKNDKKKNVKNLLDNPFTLDWPTLNINHYKNVVNLLKDSLSSVSKEITSKSIEVPVIGNEPGTNRKIKCNRLIREGTSLSHLVFGFNAVMRGLEKGQLVSLLVNSESKPSFLLKTFIPICSLKSIPVIPIKGLTTIVKDFPLGIKSCLALGFKKSVCEAKCLFYPIYCGMYKALELELPSIASSDNEERIEEAKPQEKTVTRKPKLVSKEQIKSFHLYRSSETERVFKPNNINTSLSQDDDAFLKLNSSHFTTGISCVNKADDDLGSTFKKIKPKGKTRPSLLDVCCVNSDSLFVLDTLGDEMIAESTMEIGEISSELNNAESGPSETTVINNISPNKCDTELKNNLSNTIDIPNTLIKKRKGMKNISNAEYVAAKVKRIKNNSARKEHLKKP